MENRTGCSSSSSFTETLFGPKDPRITSSGLFGSVFGPSSTGLGHTGSSNKQDLRMISCENDCKKQSMKCENGRNSIYQTEASYYSSSIYYGGQDVYPPTSNNNCSKRAFQRGGGDEDPNGSSTASRGNWWQGSLYY